MQTSHALLSFIHEQELHTASCIVCLRFYAFLLIHWCNCSMATNTKHLFRLHTYTSNEITVCGETSNLLQVTTSMLTPYRQSPTTRNISNISLHTFVGIFFRHIRWHPPETGPTGNVCHGSHDVDFETSDPHENRPERYASQ